MKKAAADDQLRADKGSRSAGSLKSVREKASNEKSRSKALARRLQKTSRIATLASDISGVIEEMARSSEQTMSLLEDAGQSFSLTGLAAADLRHIIDLIDENAEDICGAVSLITDSTETLSRVLEDSFRQYDTAIEDFATVADSNDRMRHLLDGFSATYTDMQAMDSHLGQIAELVELAGLNASLEADTDSEPPSVYSVLGSRIAGTAASFATHHDRYADKRQAFLDTWGGVRKSYESIEDRIRALTVMGNGIKSMFDDLRADVTTLLRLTQEVTQDAYQVFCHQQTLFTGLNTLETEAAQGDGDLRQLKDLVGDRDTRFEAVVSEADALAGLVDVMAEDRDFTGRLTDLYGVLEDFIDAVEIMGSISEPAGDKGAEVLGLMEKLEQSAEYTAEEMNSVQGRLGSIADRTESLADNYRRIRENLRESGKAFGGILDELDSLRGDYDTYFSSLHDLSLVNADLGRFGLEFAHMASVCDCLGILCATETAKTGDEGHACAGMSGRLGEIVRYLKEAMDKLYTVTDTVDRHLYRMMSDDSETARDSLSASIAAIREALSGSMETDITPTIDNIPVIGTTARSHAKNIKKAHNTAEDITTKAGLLSENMQEISRLISVHRDVGTKAHETAEKMQGVVDELSGE